MRKCIWVLGTVTFFAPMMLAAPPQQSQAKTGEPTWAYGFDAPPKSGDAAAPPAAPANPPDNVQQKHVDGSLLAFTQKQIADPFGPADWFPGDHPPMPEIVAHGRAKEVVACSLCHYPSGKGRPENAPPMGLSYSYFVQTMEDFKNGLRKSADPRKGNTNRMAGFAKAMTDEEIKETAQYFTSMKWTPWIKVVETNTVPKTHINAGLFIAEAGSEKEPIAGRIIEVPVNAEASEQLRDPHSGFIAYVPPGSIKKGEALVTTGGNGKTIRCAECHGADLQGLGPVSGIAGRSASYLVRQLYDMQQGTRNGVWTPLMKPVVSKLTNEDMVAIVAYVSSRPVTATAALSTGN
jgi:cytochrome c553